MDPRSSHPLLQYDKMLDQALRQVVRKALVAVSKHGLPGAHHFYLSFRTDYPGVEIAPEFRERYPDEMTIVLQHQFWGLEVDPDAFGVTLSFNNRQQRLRIPYDALTSFADPTAKFGLQFQAGRSKVPAVDGPSLAPAMRPSETGEQTEGPEPDGAIQESSPASKVVTLDTFRNKK